MPFPSVPLPTWVKPKSRPPSSSLPVLKSLEILNEKDDFGLPSVDDPDPFGVHALEEAGFEIREAGSKSRPSSDAFEYRPSPSSPIFNNFARHSIQSIDSVSRRNSRRDSRRSVKSVDHGTQTFADLGTQTIDEVPRDNSPAKKMTEDLARIKDEDTEERYQEEPEDDGEVEEEEEEAEEAEIIMEEAAPTVQYVAQTVASPIITRAKIVNIHKRIAPALPPRNPYRRRAPKPAKEESQDESQPQPSLDDEHSSHYSSPTKSTFDRNSMDSPNPWSEVTSIPDGGTPEAQEDDHVQPKPTTSSTTRDSEAEPRPMMCIAEDEEKFEEVDLYSAQPHAINTSGSSITNGERSGNEGEVFHSMPATPIE
ncbi:hypothetical protein MMC13_002623 [Lambiella insularis]|nr:hypothetical protein [Lambiella insularis]